MNARYGEPKHTHSVSWQFSWKELSSEVLVTTPVRKVCFGQKAGVSLPENGGGSVLRGRFPFPAKVTESLVGGAKQQSQPGLWEPAAKGEASQVRREQVVTDLKV